MRNRSAGNAGTSPEATRTSCAFHSLTRLLSGCALLPSLARSHRTLSARDRRRRTALPSSRGLLLRRSDRSASAPARQQNEGTAGRARSSPRGSKLPSRRATGGGGKPRGEKEGETEVFNPAAKAPPVPLTGRAQCPISTRAPPRAPREALLAAQPPGRFYGRSRKKLRSTRCQGRMD